SAFAQEAAPAAQPDPSAPAKPTSEREESEPLKITSKEVSAVQAELVRRGYSQATPTGILDAETRQALRTFQTEQQIAVTGRIDEATLAKLEIKYPATGNEAESTRRGGLIPKAGYAMKDGATATTNAVTNTAKGMKEGARSGLDKTTNAAGNAADKTGEMARDAGSVTVNGAKKVGRSTGRMAQKTGEAGTRTGRRVGEIFVGRSDADIQSDVRGVLQKDEQTVRVVSEVKNGTVTLKADSGLDLSAAVSAVRKISGVKSVVVVAR
ncbi:MAG: peptidoglycan-binding protein, partial [Alphaproteobacteria bacterium]|nr:peptidoglycan-binding protein [Alphaproteobacteria bacterium]